MPPPAPLVLDGGLSDRLRDQGCELSGELWTARLLADDPGQLLAAHRAYARAGARVLITASYQASFEGFARRGIAAPAAAGLLRDSVALAREAAGPGVRVAASVGPYGAVLGDGSEYRGGYGLTEAELTTFHRRRIEALASAGPDLLALETVPEVTEARAMLRAARGCGIPVWLSYTVAGGRTRAGQPPPASGREVPPCGGVRAGGGGGAGGGDRGELLRAGRGDGRGTAGGAAHRQTGGRVSQQR